MKVVPFAEYATTFEKVINDNKKDFMSNFTGLIVFYDQSGKDFAKGAVYKNGVLNNENVKLVPPDQWNKFWNAKPRDYGDPDCTSYYHTTWKQYCFFWGSTPMGCTGKIITSVTEFEVCNGGGGNTSSTISQSENMDIEDIFEDENNGPLYFPACPSSFDYVETGENGKTTEVTNVRAIFTADFFVNIVDMQIPVLCIQIPAGHARSSERTAAAFDRALVRVFHKVNDQEINTAVGARVSFISYYKQELGSEFLGNPNSNNVSVATWSCAGSIPSNPLSRKVITWCLN